MLPRRSSSLALVVLLATSVTAGAQTGSISGTVTQEGSGTPLAGVTVAAGTAPYWYSGAATATTAADGSYTIVGLAPGTYYVRTRNTAGYNVDEVYPNISCPTLYPNQGFWQPCMGAGSPVTVSAGTNTPGIGFALAAGGKMTVGITISGTLNDTVDLYLYNVNGTVAALWEFNVVSQVTVTTPTVPAGSYLVVARPEHFDNPYLGQIYSGITCMRLACGPGGGTPVAVNGGATTTSVNLTLARGGQIGGRLTVASTGAALTNGNVSVYRASDMLLVGSGGTIDTFGNYITSGIVSGNYFVTLNAPPGYVDQVYPGTPFWQGCPVGPASSFFASSGLTKLGINFAMEQRRWPPYTSADFDGDGRDDPTVFRPSAGTWYQQLSTGGVAGARWGGSVDTPVPRDYDGDGRTDLAVYRESTGTWYRIPSTTGIPEAVGWGAAGDLPVPADYDGDGKADVAVYRPSTGTWFIRQSLSGNVIGVPWGACGDVPVPADYDGDGRADPAVFRATTGTWFQLRSTTGAFGVGWGASGDLPIPADYDGDGKADPAVFRPATGAWFQLRSTTGPYAIGWGVSTDVPFAGDYDGDGKADPTVFRPSTGTWFLLRSTAGFGGLGWGTAGDLPQ